MESKWIKEMIDDREARLYKKKWSPTRLGHQLNETENKETISPQEFGNLLFDQTRLTQACADSGCTTTLCIPGTPMKNVRRTKRPIRLKNASGGWLETTHEDELDIPGLPTAARKAQKKITKDAARAAKEGYRAMGGEDSGSEGDSADSIDNEGQADPKQRRTQN